MVGVTPELFITSTKTNFNAASYCIRDSGEHCTEQKIVNIVKIIPDSQNIFLLNHREMGGQKQKAQQATFKNLKRKNLQ